MDHPIIAGCDAPAGRAPPRLAPIGAWPVRLLAAWVLLAGCAVPVRPVAVAESPPAPLDTGMCQSLDPEVPYQAAELPFQEWPIQWTPERERLTSAYLAHHRGPDRVTGDPTVDSTMDPRMIVLHWTAGPTAKSAWHTFDPVELKGRNLPEHQRVNLSAHFVVDRDGVIFRLMDERRVGRHTIGLNHLAVGVENVGDGRRWPLTQAQVEANVVLVRWLAERHPITHLIGHREYRLLEGHPYFEETDPTFRTGREDPGVGFMASVRAAVSDLGLAGPDG